MRARPMKTREILHAKETETAFEKADAHAARLSISVRVSLLPYRHRSFVTLFT